MASHDNYALKSAGEIFLDGKAQEIAKAEGISFAKAYEKAAEQNPHLYSMHDEEMAKRDPAKTLAEHRLEEERKAPKKPKKAEEEQELDRLARKRASETGEPFAKAYNAILETAEGTRLYEALAVPAASGE
jgi:ATPase subunit of ABC transporter with duplicated ATPase domains